MILAIGQAVDASMFECDKTRKNAIAYDPETFMTSIPGVFAGGDCGQRQDLDRGGGYRRCDGRLQDSHRRVPRRSKLIRIRETVRR